MICAVGTTPAVQRVMVFASAEGGGVNRAIRVRVRAAGKAVNAARVARALGAEVWATGLAGGRMGALLREELEAAGIGWGFVDSGVETRVCVTVIDESRGTATELVEEAAAVDAAKFDDVLAAVRGEVVVVSGAVGAGGPGDFYARVVRAAGAARTIVDGKGPGVRAAVEAGAWMVKCNATEAMETTGAGDVRAAVLLMGAPWTVATMGADGVLASDGRRTWHLTSPAVAVVSAVGSGDALAGGLAAGLDGGMDVLDALRLGVACGAANAMNELAGEVDPATARTLTRAVTVREL